MKHALMLTGLFTVLGMGEGQAQTADEGEETPPEETPADLPADQTDEALKMPSLSRAQHEWLEPQRRDLPQLPHAQTDFTAYTLEWGETKVGLASVSVGVLPHTQLGTIPVLDGLGVFNGQLKVNPVQTGTYALGIGTSYYGLRAGDMSAYRLGLSLIQSIDMLEPWSAHIGLKWSNTKSSGVPDLDALPGILTGGTSAAEFEASQKPSEWNFHLQDLTLSLATDWRFNRRDSLILQASAGIWSNVIKRGYEAPPILGLDQVLNKPVGTSVPIKETYVTSLAWQWSWRRTDLRVGAGLSNVPGAWILQSIDLSYRFGGETRRTERRMNKTWQRNKSDTGGP